MNQRPTAYAGKPTTGQDFTPRTVTVGAAEGAPTMRQCDHADLYKVRLRAVAGITSVTIWLYEGDGTNNVTPDELQYTIDFTAAPFDTEGWSKTFWVTEDWQCGCRIQALAGGAGDTVIVEEILI